MAGQRRDAAKEELTLADTTLFSKCILPVATEKAILAVWRCPLAVSHEWRNMSRRMPMQVLRLYFQFHDGCASLWHGQQCALTEYCAYVARDILCHIDLAAEAVQAHEQKANSRRC